MTFFNRVEWPSVESHPKIFNMIKGHRTKKRAPTKRVWRRHYLKEWREFRTLTVDKLAEMSGVSAGLISLIENRKSGGSPESLEALVDALKITMGDLFDVPPDPGRVLIRAWVPKEDQERVQNVIEAMQGKPVKPS